MTGLIGLVETQPTRTHVSLPALLRDGVIPQISMFPAAAAFLGPVVCCAEQHVLGDCHPFPEERHQGHSHAHACRSLRTSRARSHRGARDWCPGGGHTSLYRLPCPRGLGEPFPILERPVWKAPGRRLIPGFLSVSLGDLCSERPGGAPGPGASGETPPPHRPGEQIPTSPTSPHPW